MRYMMLVYSSEPEDGLSSQEAERMWFRHRSAMGAAVRKGILISAEPLASTVTATTVRMQNGEALLTDGPFAETKEHLTGYYIIDCQNLDDIIDWAMIPAGCLGPNGCIEIRPIPGGARAAETTWNHSADFDIAKR